MCIFCHCFTWCILKRWVFIEIPKLNFILITIFCVAGLFVCQFLHGEIRSYYRVTFGLFQEKIVLGSSFVTRIRGRSFLTLICRSFPPPLLYSLVQLIVNKSTEAGFYHSFVIFDTTVHFCGDKYLM